MLELKKIELTNYFLTKLVLQYVRILIPKIKATSYTNLFLFLCQIYGFSKMSWLVSRYIMSNFYGRIKCSELVKSYINSQTKPIIDEIRKELNQEVESLIPRKQMLEKGISQQDIVEEFKNMSKLHSFDYKNGNVSGAVYSQTPMLDTLFPKIYSYFGKSNPLHTNVFPAVRKMENDLVKMMINFFEGDEEVVGCFTSGGTESILLACKTYRDRGLKIGIKNPNMIVASTVHCAFHKAAKYFGIQLISIPTLENGKFDLYKLSQSINPQTVLVVASAPSYNLGIIDPIEEMGEICLRYGVGLHVDCCMGAFLINFTDEKYNFKVPGVTSISADYHKYGMTPKGASVIMYENKELMKHQYYIYEEWSGGVYATNTMLGSKNGNIVALSWATVMNLGLEKYRENYYTIIENSLYLQELIRDIPELFIYGVPKLNIVAIGSNLVNINILGEKLKKEGWNVNMIQNPSGFHFCVTAYHNKKVIDRFIQKVRELIPEIPDTKTKSKCIYGTMKSVQDGDIVKDIIAEYLHITNGF